jgi:hypothetical protein
VPRFEDADGLELLVEFLAQFGEVRPVLGHRLVVGWAEVRRRRAGDVGGGGAAAGGALGVLYDGDLVLGMLLAVGVGCLLSGAAFLYYSHQKP